MLFLNQWTCKDLPPSPGDRVAPRRCAWRVALPDISSRRALSSFQVAHLRSLGRLLSNTSRFNEVGKESHCDRGDPKTDGVDDLAVHRAVNGRSGERNSESVKDEVEYFHVPLFSSSVAPHRDYFAGSCLNSFAAASNRGGFVDPGEVR
jgi:hypothetical protein